MRFHCDKTLKQSVEAAIRMADETPAWLMVYLTKSLKEWLGQSCTISHQDLCLGIRFVRRAYVPASAGGSA